MALKGVNDDELFRLAEWAAARDMDLTWIEVMPMGEDGHADRLDQYWPLDDLRDRLAERYTLTPLTERTGGPARYVRLEETGQKIGFITPLTHNFCESCNRVRMTCTGELYMCLGQEDRADLRDAAARPPGRRRPAGRRDPRGDHATSPRATISTIRASARRRPAARCAATCRIPAAERTTIGRLCNTCSANIRLSLQFLRTLHVD